jgi:hypothetical protein
MTAKTKDGYLKMNLTIDELLAICEGDKIAGFLLLIFWNNQSIYDSKLPAKMPQNVHIPVFISYQLQELVDSVRWIGIEQNPWQKEYMVAQALYILKSKEYLWMIESTEGAEYRRFHCVKNKIVSDLRKYRNANGIPEKRFFLPIFTERKLLTKSIKLFS